MLTFTIRRLLISIPTLIFISLIIFLLLNLAPNDPMAQVPLTVPPEVKEKMREALGLGQPLYIQFWKWLVQFFWIEPQVLIDHIFGTSFSEGDLRVISWQTRSPGYGYDRAAPAADPVGGWHVLCGWHPDCAAHRNLLRYRHYSVFDQAGTFVTMIGYSIPPFFHRPACDRDFSRCSSAG